MIGNDGFIAFLQWGIRPEVRRAFKKKFVFFFLLYTILFCGLLM